MLDDSLLKAAAPKAITLLEAPAAVALQAALTSAFTAHGLPCISVAAAAASSSSSSVSASASASYLRLALGGEAAAEQARAALAAEVEGSGFANPLDRARSALARKTPLSILETASVFESWGAGASKGGSAASSAAAAGAANAAFLGSAASFRLGSVSMGWELV